MSDEPATPHPDMAADRSRTGDVRTTQQLDESLQRLWIEVSAIKAKIAQEEKGVRGFVNRWGPSLSFVLALFAILAGIKATWDWAQAGPDTELLPLPWVEMSYNATSRLLGLTFGLSLSNNGDRDDLVDIESITFEVPDSTVIPLSLADVRCSTASGSSLRLPLLVPKGQSIQASCESVSELGKMSAARFGVAGPRQLSVSLAGKDRRKHPMTFCLPLTDSIMADLRRSDGRDTKRFMNAECS